MWRFIHMFFLLYGFWLHACLFIHIRVVPLEFTFLLNAFSMDPGSPEPVSLASLLVYVLLFNVFGYKPVTFMIFSLYMQVVAFFYFLQGYSLHFLSSFSILQSSLLVPFFKSTVFTSCHHFQVYSLHFLYSFSSLQSSLLVIFFKSTVFTSCTVFQVYDLHFLNFRGSLTV